MISVITEENICMVNEKVLQAAAAYSAQNQKKSLSPIFIIVPDRFTLQAEKILLRHAPVLLNVRVVTFSMLFHILCENKKDVLDKTSAVLCMWRAIRDVREKLLYFTKSVDQYAFAEKMFNTINQLSSSCVDFDNLERNANSNVTKLKMHDVRLIQKRYAELIKDSIDGSGVLSWLIENIAHSEIIKESHVYLTGFEYLSVQREQVVKQLARESKSFTAGVQANSEFAKVMDEIRFAL